MQDRGGAANHWYAAALHCKAVKRVVAQGVADISVLIRRTRKGHRNLIWIGKSVMPVSLCLKQGVPATCKSENLGK